MPIYFIKNPITNTVKIGSSPSTPAKLQQLSDSCGIDLTLLGIVDGDKKELERLRSEFSGNYMSDWYNLTPALSEFLKDLQEQPKRPQMVRVRWATYQLLIEHKKKTRVSIAGTVDLAILAYFGGKTNDE